MAGLASTARLPGSAEAFSSVGLKAGFVIRFCPDGKRKPGSLSAGAAGGAAPQGGGLMLRPHIGLGYTFEAFQLGAQLSHVEFPNGDISSTQIAGVVDIPFESFRLDGAYTGELDGLRKRVSSVLHRSFEAREARFGIEVQHYSPRGNVRTTGGTEQHSFEVVGVRYTRLLGEHLSWHLSTAGAAGGESDGYAELYTGAGWQQRIGGSPFSLTAEGALGLAGGGRVDSGGGSMMRASAGIAWALTPEWSLRAQGGVVRAFDGDFEANRYGLSVERHFGLIVPSQDSEGYGGEITRSDWKIRARYEYYTEAARKNGDEDAVGLTGLQAQRLYEIGYLYAKAMGAVSGGAGGYVSGSLGAGIEYPLSESVTFYAQAGVGASGGGGIDVGGGGIAEGEAGVSVDIAPNTEITLSAGMIRGFDGELSSPTLSVGVG